MVPIRADQNNQSHSGRSDGLGRIEAGLSLWLVSPKPGVQLVIAMGGTFLVEPQGLFKFLLPPFSF